MILLLFIAIKSAIRGGKKKMKGRMSGAIMRASLHRRAALCGEMGLIGIQSLRFGAGLEEFDIC
mgnify:CR=1 FL=1